MTSTLVTGGAGFIGEALCQRLLGDGRRVVVLDRAAAGRQGRALARLAAGPAGHLLQVIHADLADIDGGALRRVLADVDQVVHLAGQPGVQGSWASGFEAHLRDNLAAGQRLLEALLDVGASRLVVASSSSVYGEVDGSGPVAEDAPLRPASPYGVAKAALEMLVGTYAARGVPAVSLRLFSVYGRRQRPDMAVARMVEALRGGQPFPLRGDGLQARDMTHVDDVVAAVTASLAADVAPGTVLNVGSGRPVTLREVLARLEALAGRPVPVTPVLPAPGDPRRTHADTAAARNRLGWLPVVDLDTGLADQLRPDDGPRGRRRPLPRGGDLASLGDHR